MKVISADLVGALSRTSRGNFFILIVANFFNKFSLTFALRQATASKLRKHIEDDVFLMFEGPRKLIFDNGGQFCSSEFIFMIRSIIKRFIIRKATLVRKSIGY